MEIKDQRPSYVVFERTAVEDRAESEAQGRYMTKNVDVAIITPIGSKDRIPREVTSWFASLDQQAREERIPKLWVDQYKQAYAAWKRGEEVPLNGTPIKGWGVLSPAQQKNITGANVLTVEDLAAVNDEGLKRIGMGAAELQQKAQTWLKAAKSTGVVVQENAALAMKIKTLEKANADLKDQLDAVRGENEALIRNMKAAA